MPLHQHSLSAAINKVKFNWLLGSTSSIQLAPAPIHTSSQACIFKDPNGMFCMSWSLESASSAGELLQKKSKLHASNISPKARDAPLSSVQAEDQVFAMKWSAKLDDYHCSIVCETRPSLVPAFILAHDIQLNDQLRFCVAPDSFSILTVDPTLNVGEFDVTPTIYCHCVLISTWVLG